MSPTPCYHMQARRPCMLVLHPENSENPNIIHSKEHRWQLTQSLLQVGKSLHHISPNSISIKPELSASQQKLQRTNVIPLYNTVIHLITAFLHHPSHPSNRIRNHNTGLNQSKTVQRLWVSMHEAIIYNYTTHSHLPHLAPERLC